MWDTEKKTHKSKIEQIIYNLNLTDARFMNK